MLEFQINVLLTTGAFHDNALQGTEPTRADQRGRR